MEQVEPFPDDLKPGSTILVASEGDPTRFAVGLQILCRFGNTADSALVVATTDSVDQTIEAYEGICPESNRTPLRVVDTTSEQQSVTSLYGDTPVVFTPSPGDFERLVVALSELSEDQPPANGERHLILRSLTPILDTASSAQVITVLERISGIRSDSGFCLLGFDWTAHEEGTLAAVADLVDGILQVERSQDRLEIEYRSTGGRIDRSMMGSDTDADAID